MKLPTLTKAFAFGLTFLCSQVAEAQTPFNSGSNGSYGPLVVDGTTGDKLIALPPDGILHCTTVTITANRSLNFTKNATNTPAYILATGDVNIGGNIFAQGDPNTGRRGGEGGPGGFGGGQGGMNPSNGSGPGGGKGGWYSTTGLPAGKSVRGGGGFGTAGTRAGTGGSIYGNSLLIPLSGGSGGGGGDASAVAQQFGGGGGGGAILIASNTRILFTHNIGNGYIGASGGFDGSGNGGGSGGAVRLVAPIIQPGGQVEVYFPAGEAWFDLDSGERLAGGQVRIVNKALLQLPAWGREGHVLCLGRAVMHTGEIDLTAPVEEIRLFGVPMVQPCVMNQCITLHKQDGVVYLSGQNLRANQCLPSSGLNVTDTASGVRINLNIE